MGEESPSPPQRTWRDGLLGILEEIVWLSLVFVGAVAVALGAGEIGGSAEAAGLFAFHAGLFLYGCIRERSKLRTWFRPTRAALFWGLGTGVAMILTGALYSALLNVLGIEIPDLAAELRAIVPNPALLIAWGAFFVPIAEEIYFRGRLIDTGRRYLGLRGAVALAGFAFAIVHGVPVLIPAYLALAWLLWKARDRTGGLLAPVIAHALNNLLGMLAEGP